MKHVYAYVVTFAVLLALDLVWLSLAARSFYAPRLGSLLLDQPRWGVAAIFYALYAAGLVYFAVTSGFSSGWAKAALNGGLFGFFSYLTYNFSNLATLRGYDAVVAVVDTGWGTILGAATAAIAVVVLGLFGWGN